jgi:hypothetical protein
MLSAATPAHVPARRPAAAPVALEPGGAVEQEPHVDVVGQQRRLDAPDSSQ